MVDPNLDSNNQRAIVDAAACNLAARRDSASDSAALTETAGEAETEEGQSGSTKDGEALTSNVDSEVARRRSSVLQRIPDNVRKERLGESAGEVRFAVFRNSMPRYA